MKGFPMKGFILGSLAITAMCLLLSTANASPFDFEKIAVDHKQVVYKTVGDVKLIMHVFRAKDLNVETPQPAVVFFFGGGWVGGNPKQFFPHCQYFATRGMVAMAAEYRIRSKHGTTPFECVEDGKSAVRWVRANAKKLGIDPTKIVAGGGSAGGHVAACTGVIEGFNTQGEDADVSSKPNAMMLFNPVTDTTKLGYGSSRLKGREKEISPNHHVVKGIVPTIIFHGTADTTVPFENVERFTRLMNEAGNECKLVPLKGQKHGFFNFTGNRAAFRDTVRAGDKFLVEQGILLGKPTL